MSKERLRVKNDPRLEDDGGDDAFAVLRVGQSNDGGFANVGVSRQHRLDFGWRDVGPASDDQVGEATEDVDVAVAVDVDKVACSVPTVCRQCCGRQFGIGPVSDGRRGAACPCFARRSWLDLVAVAVDELEAGAGHDSTGAARAGQRIGDWVVGDDWEAF